MESTARKVSRVLRPEDSTTTIADKLLTETLAIRVLGWKLAPGRFLKSDRAWTPRWKFAPLTNVSDAFDLLEATKGAFTIRANRGRVFEVEVRLAGRVGIARGDQKARTISLAVADALAIEVGALR